MLLIIAGAVSAAAGGLPSQPARWVEVAVATDGTKAYLDTASLRETGGVVTLNQRFVLAAAGPGKRSRVDQTATYACRTRTARPLQSSEFDVRGKLLRHERSREPASLIPPGSLPEVILDLVC